MGKFDRGTIKKNIKNLFWFFLSWFSLVRGRNIGWSKEKLLELEDKYYEKHFKGCIIVMFDGRCVHGGLTDRLRGITSVYDYCAETGIDFRVHFTHPFRLENYLLPNKVSWNIPECDIVYDKMRSEVKFLYDFDIHPILHKKAMDEIAAKVRKGKQIHLYTNTKFRDEHFRLNFENLFQINSSIKSQVEFHANEMDNDFISISFRFTTLLGDFKDCINKPLPEEEQENLMKRCMMAIGDISQRAPSHKRILVTADSEKFLNKVGGEKSVYVVKGRTGHFDYAEEDEDAMVQKTFIDFFLISKAKQVYLVRSGEMYKSGFAKHAAQLGNRPFFDYRL